jgi:long-chain acyl-CoA synthetase
MIGYHNKPADTAAVIQDGWFHTGDVGTLDADGYLAITDRKKDLLVTSGGKKIAPQPIENAIKVKSNLIGQAVIYGDRRPYCVALLTPSEEAVKRFGGGNGTDLSKSAELRAEMALTIKALNGELASWETIKDFAVLSQDFTEAAGEVTPSMKVKRKVVIDKYRDVIEGLYAAERAD